MSLNSTENSVGNFDAGYMSNRWKIVKDSRNCG